MARTIIEGMLADVDGVRPGQVVVEDGVIAAVGTGLGRPDHVFGDCCLIFAGMGDIHIHAREDVTGRESHKETFATAAAAALHGGVVHVADMPNNPAAPVDDASYACQGAGSSTRATCRLPSRSMPASAQTRGRCRGRFRTRRTWGRASATCSSRSLEDLDRTLAALPRPGRQLPLRGSRPARPTPFGADPRRRAARRNAS